MMRKVSIIVCAALCLLLSSCFTSYVSTNRLLKVQEGMSQQEVVEILGEPDYRRFDGDMEEWEFEREKGTPVLDSNPMTIIVHFVGKKVVSMDTFSSYHRPTPPHPVVVTPPVPPVEVIPEQEPVREIRVMTDSEFDDFISKLKFTVLTEDQKKLIGQMLQKHDVTSDQSVRIVKEIFMSDDKMEMMKKIYPYVRDKRNFNKVINLLSSSMDKDKMRKFIKEYHQKNN